VRFEDLIRRWNIIGDVGDDAYRVAVRDQKVRITKHDAMLERAIRASRQPGAAVCKSEWKWRTRQDSNLWPLPSEGWGLPEMQRFWRIVLALNPRTRRELTHVADT